MKIAVQIITFTLLIFSSMTKAQNSGEQYLDRVYKRVSEAPAVQISFSYRLQNKEAGVNQTTEGELYLSGIQTEKVMTENMIAKIVEEVEKKVSELENKKKELEEKFSIQIQYLELRNKTNLDLSMKKQNSKLFVAYYLNHVRLIDNF